MQHINFTHEKTTKLRHLFSSNHCIDGRFQMRNRHLNQNLCSYKIQIKKALMSKLKINT